MPSSRPVSLSVLGVVASGAVFVLGAALAHAETPDDARLRQLAGQAASYAGEVRSLLAKGADPNVPDPGGGGSVLTASAPAPETQAPTVQAALDTLMEALTTAHAITNNRARALVLGMIAEALGKAGDARGVTRIFSEAPPRRSRHPGRRATHRDAPQYCASAGEGRRFARGLCHRPQHLG